MRWCWFPMLGAIACVGYILSPEGIVADTVFVAVGSSALSAIVVGILVNRPASVAAWTSIAAGSGLWVLGDAAFVWIAQTTGSVPQPSFADIIYLLGYPVLAAGLYLLVHRRWRRGELGHVANSAIVMIAFGLFMWVFVVDLSSVDVGVSAGVIDVTYAAMDVYLLGLLVHFVGAVQWKSTSFRLLTAAVLANVLADTASNFVSPGTPTDAPMASDLGFLVFYVLVGTAALHPSMRTLAPARSSPRSDKRLVASFNTPTVVVLTVATFTPPAAMAVLLYRGEPVQEWGWGVVLSALVLVGLVFVRIIELLRLLHKQTRTLREVAETDTLTGLKNRRGMEMSIDALTGGVGPVALLLLDIDRFQEINDTFGHEIGDEVLCVVATRLDQAVGPGATVGRVGADEFAIALHFDKEGAQPVAQRMNRSLRTPITVRGATLIVEASVGIAYSTDHDSIDLLIQRAGLAVHSAKAVQPRIAHYDPSMDRDNSTQLLLLSELTAAIDARHLEVYYQPQVDLSTMRVTSVEALLRWNDPDRGIMEPDLFLPMAERTGLMRPLAEFVLTEALAQRRLWSCDGLDLVVSINLSTRNLLDVDLVGLVGRSLSAADTSPDALAIEITETAAMTDPQVAIETMTQLRNLGVTLALDDYGTGYSSLAYLQRLPVQQLKIDKAFVRDMNSTLAHRVIVQSTIDLARALGLTVTAEGVENRKTLLELRTMQCTTAQGYHLGHPVPGDEIPARVAALHGELKELAVRP